MMNLNFKSSYLFKTCCLFFMLMQVFVVQAQVQVSGTVHGDQNVPISGATVKQRGTTKTVLTDGSGAFRLNVERYPVEIEVTYIGYQTKSLTITNSNAVTVSLDSETSEIDEVVVVAYGTQKRRDVVGSVAQINGDEIKKAPAMNITNTLAGRLPGLVSLQTSGRPGNDDATLYVRGISTYGSNRTPLIIIDGIQRPSFSHLDASEIEAVTILKDAVATSTYGIQASGGVILITTKRGNTGKPRFSYDAALNIGQNTRFPKYLNGPDYMEWFNKAIEVDNDYREQNNIAAIPYLYAPEWIEAVRNGTNTNPLLGDTDWVGMLLANNSKSQHHGLTIDGGTDRVKYFTAIAHLDQDGVIKNTNFKRYNIRSNVETKINDYITVGVNLGLRQEQTNTPGISPDHGAFSSPFDQAVRMLPNVPMYAENGLPITYNANGGYVNPIASVEKSGYQRTRRNVLEGTANLNVKVPGVEGLEARVIASYDVAGREQKSWLTPYETMGLGRDQVTGTFLYMNTLPGITKNTLRQNYSANYRKSFQPAVSYNRTFNEDHSLGALLVYDWSQASSNIFSAGVSNLPITLIQEMDYGSVATDDQIRPTGSSGLVDSRAGYIARLNYGYKGRYLLEAVSRWDASINFAPQYRWEIFPAAGLAWVASEENFVADNFSFLDYLKFKTSVGRSGNDRQGYGSFAYLQTLSQTASPSVVVDGEPVRAVFTNALSNPDLKWETTTTYNVGFESIFLNGKFGFDFEWFYKYTKDILGSPTGLYPMSIGGYYPSIVNIGEFDNRGFDAQLRFNESFGDFKVRLTGNLNWSRNRYLKFAEGDNITSWQSLIGKPLGTKIGFIVDGMVQTWDEARNTPSPSSGVVAPGFFKYRDLNGDGKITRNDDMTYVGRANVPELMYGFNIDLSYKGFDLAALFQGAGLSSVNLAGTYASGVDDNTNYTRTFYGYGNSPYFLVENAWRPDNTDAEFPRLTANRGLFSPHNAHKNSAWERRSDYLRLKSLQLSYTFPKKWMSIASIETLRIHFTGSNLMTWDHLKYLDPEMPNVNNGFYPQQRIYAFGANITF
ncbi:TonB-dependent receptor [Sphingobacterium olei]|uniref:TonB-dependent receptor n=1 Tax=Sphingobacterium olei TaxID=2571155 RepID=A0A4U0PGL8_9SPHI|nr:TonB-dependent receptor [Sphingobacterium olei]TJZ61924.1 TonB-dependent receptor [Sphingobacterium olei]